MEVVVHHQACDLILFGTLGDLASKKLLPALYQLQKFNLLHTDTRIIGVALMSLTDAAYAEFVSAQLQKYLRETIDYSVWEKLRSKLHIVKMDLTIAADYEKLSHLTDPAVRTPISYFATPSFLYGQICQGLDSIGLAKPHGRVVLEKPIGHDLPSSIRIHDEVAQFFKEDQIYRIDHYLAKDTVLNVLVLRFANAIFASLWDHHFIDHVQISVAEEVGVEGRWNYYDNAGQGSDMLQNHLLQILSLIAMEQPKNLDADSIRYEKLKVLKALRPITRINMRENTVRGQYTSGSIRGEACSGYLDEKGACTGSTTETFVAIKVDIDNGRWDGVPFYLRTGKRMPEKHSEVVICFKLQPHSLFHAIDKQANMNKLIIRLQPDEGIELQMLNKWFGLEEIMKIQQTRLDLSFHEIFKEQRVADAYERLLLEVMLGRQYFFVSRDEVESAWKWFDSIVNAWQSDSESLYSYPAGTWGPEAAHSLLAQDGRCWNKN